MNISDKKVGILTLGCKVNQYESEAIAEACEKYGLKTASPDEVCDIYIVNTCTVTAEADRKARQMIRQLHRRNTDAPIIVCGCYAQRSPDAVAQIEGVSFVCGNLKKLRCAEIAREFANGRRNGPAILETSSLAGASFEEMSIVSFPRTRQYIKIEDGCENRCSYCAICDARGPVRSKSSSDIIAEAIGFCEKGCREIVLTGIETASYGKDTGENLGDLLAALDKELKDVRIRLGSVDPTLFRPAFLEKIAPLSCVAPHFHISMQSGSSKVLALMRRRYNASQAAQFLSEIRKAIPGVMFTTDIIVGFPGETEEDYLLTKDFIKDNRFLMTHVFPFSARKGTEAASMTARVPEEEKHRRVNDLSSLALEVRTEILDGLNGTTQKVLFETYDNGRISGHTGSFVEISCEGCETLRGKFADVKILSNDGNVCSGTII